MLAAAAIKCLGGRLLGRLWPRDDDEASRARAAGYDPERVLTTDDLVGSDNCFFAATGVTDGDIAQGRALHPQRGATTQSIVMRSRSGTVRFVDAIHDRAKLRAVAGERYG